MRIPQPGPAYDRGNEAAFREAVRKELTERRRADADVELTGGQRLIIRSSNGVRYRIVVSDAGVLSTSAV